MVSTPIIYIIAWITTHLPTRKGWRLSWPGWLTYSGHFIHKMVSCQPYIRRRSGKVLQPKTDVLTTESRRQPLLLLLYLCNVTCRRPGCYGSGSNRNMSSSNACDDSSRCPKPKDRCAQRDHCDDRCQASGKRENKRKKKLVYFHVDSCFTNQGSSRSSKLQEKLRN